MVKDLGVIDIKNQNPKCHTNGTSNGNGITSRSLNRGIVQMFNVIDNVYLSELKEDVFTILDVVNKERRSNEQPPFGTKENPIVLEICSEGGDVYPSLGIYDFVKNLREKGVEVDGYVQGYAASAACMIVLQAVRNRLSTQNSRFLLHEAREWSFSVETTSSIKDKHKEFDTLQRLISKIIGDRANKTAEEVDAFIGRKELWLSAQEAKEFGLIDTIV